MGERTKVAVLGGGVGSMVAAFELTRPEYADRFEVTVYQLGWRLGGKGASGRDRANGDRILEHGLHVWFGFYDQAWKAMRAAYEELGRPPGSPLDSIETAFTRCDQVVLYDLQGDEWHALPRDFPRNAQRPGDPHPLPTLQDVAIQVVRWARAVFEPRFRESDRIRVEAEDLDALLREAEELADPVTDEELSRKVGDPFPVGPFVRLLRRARDLAWRTGEVAIRSDPQIRMLFTMFDTAVSSLSGIVEDDVLGDGFDAVNDWELCDWLAHHGAKEVTVGRTPEEHAPILRSVYDVAFGYPEGDIAQANVAAGTALTDLIRLAFGYRGSVFYKMNAGMGDVVFAPFYEALKARGVKFEFFHAVTDVRLSQDGKRVTEVDVVRQVELEQPYEPLYPVPVRTGGTLPCWPSEPLWEQLPADARGRNFEDESRIHEGTKLTLSPDAVVLGISIASLPGICKDVIAKHEVFANALQTAVTVRTQAFQLWLNQPARQLGWAHRSQSVAGAYVEPLDTYCEMSHLLPVEHYEGTRSIAYFCGVQKEDRGGDQAAATESAKQDALEFLRRDAGPLWPHAVDEDGALRPDLLVGGVDAQYFRANIAGSERYVLSPAGTITQRVSPAGFGVENLLPVGDWTRTGVDGGCVEAAAISGIRAAHKLIGDDHEIPGEDPRWLRKR
jgi:uncharacterized protein with NAD-binding domain and iron-sulfur cluster